jgi:hypothetical protein
VVGGVKVSAVVKEWAMPKFSVKEPVLAIALLAAGLAMIMGYIQSKRQG